MRWRASFRAVPFALRSLGSAGSTAGATLRREVVEECTPMNRSSMGAAVLCACVAGAAQANRPLNTDTADVIQQGRCQFEPYVASTRSSGTPSLRSSILQLNCGVPHDTQLGVAYGRSSSAGLTDEAVSVAGKTNLIELKDRQTGVALSYGLSAARSAGSGWAHEGSFVNLIATRSLVQGLLVHADLGASRSQSARQDSTTWALAFEWAVAPRLDLSAEAYGDDRTKPWLATGVHWVIKDNFSVNASFGVQTEKPQVRQLTAGFNIEF